MQPILNLVNKLSLDVVIFALVPKGVRPTQTKEESSASVCSWFNMVCESSCLNMVGEVFSSDGTCVVFESRNKCSGSSRHFRPAAQLFSGVPLVTDDFPHDQRRPLSFRLFYQHNTERFIKHQVATGSVLVRSLAGSDEYVDKGVMLWPGIAVFFVVDGERGGEQRLYVLCEAHG